MPTVTTRPSSTISNGDSTPSAGTRHACLSDDGDSTYVTLTGTSQMVIQFANPTIPAGATVTGLTLRARSGITGFGNNLRTSLLAGLGHSVVIQVDWLAPTTTVLQNRAYSTTPTSVQASLRHDGTYDDEPIVLYELYLDTTYSLAPEVAVDAPTGTITHNLPTIEWTDTLGGVEDEDGFRQLDDSTRDGGPQTHFEVKVFTDAQYGAGGFDPASSTPTLTSGIVASGSTVPHGRAEGEVGPSNAGNAREWADTDTLLENDTYRAYVRVAQTGPDGQPVWSDWEYGQFTVNASKPSGPSITATEESSEGRIRLAVSGSALQLIQVQSSADGGLTWGPVRTRNTSELLGLTNISQDHTLWDFEAPNGTEMTYRVRRITTDVGGQVVVSDWSEDTATWQSTKEWLKHPTDPELNLEVTIASMPGTKRAASQGVFKVLGREDPVIVSDVRSDETGDIAFDLPNENQDAFTALLDANVPLLLQTLPGSNFEDRWVSFGDLDNPRSINRGYSQATIPALPWIKVAQPTGDIEDWPVDAS